MSDAVAQAEEIQRDKEGYITVYGDDHYIKPSVLIEKCFITPGSRYNSAMVDRTYEYMSQLGIIRSINIELQPVSTDDGNTALDAYILLIRNRKQSVAFEVEGTNSEGDLGFGVGVTYQHRNLFHGSQLFTAKFRSSYESLSGNLDNFINKRYTEQAAEVGITFPRFIFPFLSRRFKHNIKASSELALSFNYQERPEFTRIIAGAGWKYKWNNRFGTRRSTWDFVDISYIHMPNSIDDFIDQLNARIRYSYEDHFIMRMGFTYQWTNRRIPAATGGILTRNRLQPRVYNMRASVETAGNLLYAYSSVFKQKNPTGCTKSSARNMPSMQKPNSTTPCSAISTPVTDWLSTPAWAWRSPTATPASSRLRSVFMPEVPTESEAGPCGPSVPEATPEVTTTTTPISSTSAATSTSCSALNTAPSCSGFWKALFCRCRQYLDHTQL